MNVEDALEKLIDYMYGRKNSFNFIEIYHVSGYAIVKLRDILRFEVEKVEHVHRTVRWVYDGQTRLEDGNSTKETKIQTYIINQIYLTPDGDCLRAPVISLNPSVFKSSSAELEVTDNAIVLYSLDGEEKTKVASFRFTKK